MMGWDDGAWSAGDWLAMSLMMVVFWGLLAVLVVWVVRNWHQEAARPRAADSSPNDPYEVLALRFARGEIDEEEFRRRRELLQAPTGHS